VSKKKKKVAGSRRADFLLKTRAEEMYITAEEGGVAVVGRPFRQKEREVRV